MSSSLFDQNLKKLLLENDFTRNAFFESLASQLMTKEQFIETQQQFYHAVLHFSSPLALVAAAIPSYQQRLLILKNLWEEHGEGNLQQTHGATFTELLRRLTGNDPVILAEAEEAVLVFNQTLSDVCKNRHFLESVAMMGMIERMFADISAEIGTRVVELGWLRHSEMIHYSVHKDLDCIHAEDFFSILRPYYQEQAHRLEIDQGLNLGALTFLRLYSGLWEKARKR